MARTRERDDRIVADLDRDIDYTDQYGTSGTLPMAWSHPSIWTGSYQVMSDYPVKRFKERSARGEIINNQMDSTKESRRLTAGFFSYYKPDSPYNYTQTWPEDYSMFHPYLDSTFVGVDHLPHALDISAAEVLAGTRAHANVDPDVFASWVFLGELRETVSFLRSPLKSFNGLLKSIYRDKNKLRFRRNWPLSAFLRDNWLAYRYAIRPMFADMQNGIDAFNIITKGGQTVAKRQTARAMERITTNDTVYETVGYHDRVTSTDTSIVVRCGVLYRLAYQPDTLGLRLSKLPLALWELTPYSFVMDWFANVGPYIRAITPKFGVKVLAEWTTTTTTQRTSCESTMGNLAAPRVITSQLPASYHIDTKVVKRRPTTEIGLSSKFSPFIGEDYKLKRIVDSLALSHGQAQRMLRRR